YDEDEVIYIFTKSELGFRSKWFTWWIVTDDQFTPWLLSEGIPNSDQAIVVPDHPAASFTQITNNELKLLKKNDSSCRLLRLPSVITGECHIIS
ncbi:unnamed protein product, partial [Brassica oleracea]